MPVPSDITALSTTAASNSPPGSETPSSIDDYLRSHASFIAQMRAVIGGATDPNIPTNITTSAADTTAGRLTKVGDFGLGTTPAQTTSIWPETSINNCTGASQGFWRTGASTTDLPANFSTACTLILQVRSSAPSLELTQTLVDSLSGNRATRVCSGGTIAAPTWGIWSEPLRTRGVVANANSILGENGIYTFSNTTTNTPVAGGWFSAINTGGNVIATQLWQPNGPKIWSRSLALDGVTWGGWYEIPTTDQMVATRDTSNLGFGTGSGGTVTQATSKATGVTLNKPSGRITMNGAALAANTAVSFTLTNSSIAATDTPVVTINSAASAGAYSLQVDAVAAGSCRVSVRNLTGASLSEALVLQFNIIKGAIA